MDIWEALKQVQATLPPPPKTRTVRVRDAVQYNPSGMWVRAGNLRTNLYRYSEHRMRLWIAQEYPNHALVSLTRMQSYDKDHLNVMPQPDNRHCRTEIIDYDAELLALQ